MKCINDLEDGVLGLEGIGERVFVEYFDDGGGYLGDVCNRGDNRCWVIMMIVDGEWYGDYNDV